MAQRLGDILRAEGLVSQEALEEALELQVVHGGRLGTNLVELGLLSEADLARCLGRLHNVAFASGSMVPDPRALAAVDRAFADEHDLVPMRIDPKRLSVACVDPGNLAPLDKVAFITGRRVTPVVVCEFRLNHLLRKHLGAFRTVRPIDMGQTRPSRTRKASEQSERPQVADLMGEDEFNALYANVVSARPTSAPVPVSASVSAAGPATEAMTATAAAPALAKPKPAAQPEPEPEPEKPEPLTFAAAQAELAKAPDREVLSQTVLRYALGKWKRALILNVQGPLLTGWHGVGLGIRDSAVRRIAVALRDATTFKLVCDTRSHFVGPMKRDPGTAVFYRTLGGDYPNSAVILPLLVGGKVVHLLYVDDGPGKFTAPDVGELMILSQSVARSYEAMIRRRKSN